MKNLLIAVIIFFGVFNSNAQQYHFKNYSLEQGLSRSGVFSIIQDHEGYIWIGTDGGGLCKFDGKKFTNYTRYHGLASETIRVLFEDENNVLWLGTDKGLCYYDGESFQTLSIKQGLSDSFVRHITQDEKGNLWIGTDRGISIIDPNAKKISEKLKVNFNLPHKKVRAILADSNIVWIGTDGGLCRYDNEKIEVINEQKGLIDDVILNLFIDTDKNVWVGTEKGISRISPDKTIRNFTVNDGIISERIRSISQDLKGNIWIGTNNGISIFDGKNFKNISKNNGLSNDRIRCIEPDCFGNMWIGTHYGGIMRYNEFDFIAFTPREGLISNQINWITEDEKGHIIVGTVDGVTKIYLQDDKIKSLKYYARENGLAGNYVNTIFKDNLGYYWYGTNAGITVMKGEEIFHFNSKNYKLFEDDNVTFITKIDTVIFAGTKNGLAEIFPNQDYTEFEVRFLTIHDGLAGRDVSGVIRDKNNNIWISFADGGLSVLDGMQLINPLLDENISEINSIRIDENNTIWLGTNGKGIYYGKYNKNNKTLDLKNISIQDKLSSNHIYSLIIDKDQVWVSHEKGIDLLYMSNDSLKQVYTFGQERGFIGLQNNRNASFKDSKGKFWFGTVNGLYVYDNKFEEPFGNGEKSITYIQNININGDKYSWMKFSFDKETEKVENLDDKLELPYNLNNISFDFIALNFIAPEKIKYKWKLDGFDTKWSNPTSKNYCTYTNLEPGTYTLLIKSSNEKGEFSEEFTSFDFTILKPFWSTWWFRILVFILGVITIILIVNYRTKKLIEKQKDLEAIISERTNEITLQNKELEKTKREIENQHEELQDKTKEITDSIVYSRRIQKSLLPGSEKIKSLIEKYFIYYKPKDIVSGDFYWIEKNPKNENHLFFAAADCTGHGVPGAMVSLLSTRALNSALKEYNFIQPSLILDKTNEIVVESFTDYETGEVIRDGMDICLCSLNYSNENQILFEYAGAQNPVWIIRKIEKGNLFVNGNEVIPDIQFEDLNLFEIKATKQPIGYYDKIKPFENNKAVLSEGDRIYLFTDGFADQFGGERGKKYKYKNFKEFLLSIQPHPLNQQKMELRQEFLKWIQDFEQVDDICVMGVEV